MSVRDTVEYRETMTYKEVVNLGGDNFHKAVEELRDRILKKIKEKNQEPRNYLLTLHVQDNKDLLMTAKTKEMIS